MMGKQEPALHWRYQHIKTIGQGGFGKVLLVRDLLAGRELALKLSDPAGGEALKAEFARLRRLRHPGLPEAYDFCQTPDSACFSQEYCPGELLSERLTRGPLSQQEAFAVLHKLAQVVSYLHQRGLVHGDLKPGNVILNGKSVKLIDLGLARIKGFAARGRSAGTPAYSSPEVLSGQEIITQASDVYSLGLLTYEMLTGELPRPDIRLNPSEPLMADLKRISSGAGSDLLMAMLRYDPLERPGSAGEMLLLARESGVFPEPPPFSGFQYSAPRGDLKKMLSLCCRNDRIAVSLAGGAGSGKTMFLRELNQICQILGKASYFLDAGVLAESGTAGREFEDGAALFLDNAGRVPGIADRLIGSGRYKVVLAVDGRPGLAAAKETFYLSRATDQNYRVAINDSFPGISDYDGMMLGRWLAEQAGSDFWQAEKMAGYLSGSGLITLKGRIWNVDWVEIFKQKQTPPEVAGRLRDWWENLTPDQKASAVDISLGRVPSTETISPAVEAVSASDGKRWAIKDAQSLGLVTDRWSDSDTDEFISRLEAAAGADDGFFSRDIYRAILAGRQEWAQWVRLTLGLLELAEAQRNVYRALLLSQELILSGRINEDLRRRLSAGMTDYYCRFGQWEKALETWKTIDNGWADEWQYRTRLFYILSNGGFFDVAEKTASGMVQETGGRPELALLAKAFLGYIAGIKDAGKGSGLLNQCLSLGREMGSTGVQKAANEFLGMLSYHNKKWAEALEYFLESQKFWNGRVEPYEKIRAYSFCGIACWMMSSFAQAEQYLQKAISLLEKDVPDQILGKLFYSLGSVHFSLKEWQKAEKAYETAIYHNLGIKNDKNYLKAMFGLANVAVKQGRFKTARRMTAELYARYLKENDQSSLVGCLLNSAIIESALGQYQYAQRHLERAMDLSRQKRQFYDLGTILKVRALVEMEHGAWEKSFEDFSLSLAESARGSLQPDAEVLLGLAFVEYMLGRKQEAFDRLRQVEAGDNPVLKSRIKGVEGMVSMSDQSTRMDGLKMIIEAGRELMESGDRFAAATFWLQSAEETIKHGDSAAISEIMPWLLKAESEFLEMDAAANLARARQLIIGGARNCFARPGQRPLSKAMLEGIYQLAEMLSAEGSQTMVVQSSLKLAVEMSGAERGAIFLLDENAKIKLAAQIDIDDQTQNDAMEFSASAVLNAAGQEDVIMSNDASIDEAFSSRLSVRRNVIRSLMCVPIRFREGAAGAIYLDSRVTAGLFGKEQKEFVAAFARIIGAVLESSKLMGRLRAKNEEPGEEISSLIIGQSPAIQRMVERIRTIASAEINVLLDGESGSGKEVVAQAIHRYSNRRSQKFLALDCGSLPETLLESELFGYAKGAFTGAHKDKTGLFKSADGGTVFLDEIASASQAVQARLLRVLESGEVRRVGESESCTVDVRVICATNKDLEIEINEGRFREDLYYRLKVVSIPIPPLRERGNDILLLAEFFKDKYQKKFGKIGLRFSSEAKYQMLNYSWPGNVRELENTVQKAVLLANAKTIYDKDLEISSYRESEKDKRLNDQEREIVAAVKKFNGNITLASKALGISRRHFYRLMEKYGINKK